MVETYILNTELLDKESLFKKKLQEVDSKRKEKIIRLPFADQKLSLGAGLMIKELAGKITSFNKQGKPVCDETEFNISHSGKYVVLSKGQKPVGVDIQILKKGSSKIAHRFFTTDECVQIDRSYDVDCTFTRIWTLKEAFLKCIGTGIGNYLNKFTIFLDDDQVKLKQNIRDNSFFFKEYSIDGYKLAVCSEESEFSPVVKDVTNLTLHRSPPPL